MTNWKWLGGLVLVTTLTLTGVSRLHGDDKQKYTIEDVRKAWQARQDRVTSGRFFWKEEQTDGRGIYSYFLRDKNLEAGQMYRKQLGLPEPPLETVLPARDTTNTVAHELWFTDAKMHWSRRGNHAFCGIRLTYVPLHYTGVFDGKLAKTLATQESPIDPWPQGAIQVRARPIDAGVISTIPVMMAFRPFSPVLRVYDIQEMRLTGQRDLVDGRPCLHLVTKKGPQTFQNYWVDPAREFVLTRVLEMHEGKVLLKADLRYKPHPVAGWVPDAWDLVSYNNKGSLNKSQRGIVTECDLNADVPASQFDIDFPEGTMVYDERTRKSHVVQKGGRKRVILRAEQDVPYETLMTTDTGEPIGRVKWWHRPAVWASGVLGGVALGLGGLWWRKRRQTPANFNQTASTNAEPARTATEVLGKPE